MPASIHAGDVLAERYQMVDLLSETAGGWFWCAHDNVLQRQVAVHLIAADDERADKLMSAARRSAALIDRRNLRVLDADSNDDLYYVVNEWGSGMSLDKMLADEGALTPRRAAWLVAEVADTLAVAHTAGRAHGRMFPENVLVDENGQVRIIGFGVDAALHGLPVDRPEQDVRDLVSVLYAALTGRWPGAPTSRVPAAPEEGGHPLRPRQVRAGVPRVLDQICEEVLGQRQGAARSGAARVHTLGVTLPGLGHRVSHDLSTAAGIRDVLEEFLGEVATGSLPTTADVGAAHDMGDLEVIELVEATEETSASSSATASDVTYRPSKAAPASSVEAPTEAGMPVFHEGEHVEWLRARGNRPAPPPDFEDPAERPLFAPDPDEGVPLRRPRAPRPAPSDGSEYWPWDTSTGHGPHTSGSGSGLLPAVVVEPVPGRRWMRLAWAVGLGALILLGLVAAYQLGGGGGLNGTDQEQDPTSSPSAAGTPTELTAVTDVTVSDFDPEGNPPEENPDLAPLAIDGDPTTAWLTKTYKQQFGPAGLKFGVGLTVDLGETRDVRRVEIAVSGDTSAEVHLSDEPLASMEGSDAAGQGSDPSKIVIDLDEARPARFVTVWLTSIPAIDSGFRGEVSEIVVSE